VSAAPAGGSDGAERRPPADRVFVLGAGRAGKGLARALDASGVALAGLHGRRAEPAGADGAPAVTAGALPPSLGGAGVVLVAVQDAALDGAIAELLAAPPLPGAVLLQASGSAEPERFADARRAGHPAGTFHPLVPLADPSRAPALLRGAWVGAEGDPAAVAAARRLAAALGASVLEIPAGEKARYHAAAVFASNFPTVLAAIAARLMREAGVAEGDGRDAVRALLAAAAANVASGDPLAALTGPVVRGDVVTVRRHLDALADDGDARAVYLALSRAALGMLGEGRSAPALRELVGKREAERPTGRHPS
jgi:predicted short-subunit dehydrogenase-like oxidoreductase (DUF2520 family)